MAADVNLGSPASHPGSGSDEIHNFGTLRAEETFARDAASPRDLQYRTGYRDGFRDAGEKAADDEEPKEPPAPRKSLFRRILPFAIAGLVVAILVVGALLYWLDARHYESTDDAFIDAHVANTSSQISGRVTGIFFDDNQDVTRGQTLIEIDRRDYQEKLDQARASLGTAAAQLAQAQAQLGVQKANLEQAVAQVRVSEADSLQAEQDLARYKGVDPRAVTRQDVDKTTATARTSQARLEASRGAVTGAHAQIDAASAQIQAAAAGLREAQVNVDNAELQLSYTVITAPIDGRVTKRNVEPGTYVAPGQALVAIVPRDVWVTANFKETQLTGMKPGDPVDIKIDSYPDITFHGRVDSLQSGTGSVFSTLPAENATGNYVKVIQRLPVKIVFDDDRLANVHLAPGLSVVPRVKVR
jgi:membrane fusion protein (multidrug efflux system)